MRTNKMKSSNFYFLANRASRAPIVHSPTPRRHEIRNLVVRLWQANNVTGRTRFWAEVWRDQLDNARPRAGFPRSRLELEHWEKGYLSVVESGDRRGRIKAGAISAIGRFWAQFLHLDVSEQGAETQVLGKYCRSVSTLGMARFYLYVVLQDGVL